MTVAPPLRATEGPTSPQQATKVAKAMTELRSLPTDLDRYLHLRHLQR